MSADLVEFALTVQQQPETKTLLLTPQLDFEATWPREDFEVAVQLLKPFDPLER